MSRPFSSYSVSEFRRKGVYDVMAVHVAQGIVLTVSASQMAPYSLCKCPTFDQCP